MIHYWLPSGAIDKHIYIPKYYDPSIRADLTALSDSHELLVVRKLIENGILEVRTGHEIGKLAYGTGDIPFVRTSDISNWEIKATPKQGVSGDIYNEYASTQDVREDDLLLVRDGTYLIGTSCIVTDLELKILFQSHILKFRIKDSHVISPELLFLAFNSHIVQRQIRSFQFTADTIDTLGNRYLDLVLPIPKSDKCRAMISREARAHLAVRKKGRALIRSWPNKIERILLTGQLDAEECLSIADQQTVSSEFGEFTGFWLNITDVRDRTYIPRYYNPAISEDLREMQEVCSLVTIGELENEGVVECRTGDEIGKMAYGTGDIPFVRTSDFANWEIKYNPKQLVSREIYASLAASEDVRPLDIFLVRDGTYLVGASCIVTENDAEMLYCGGLYKIRSLKNDVLSPWLLLGLLNSRIVKRQIRSKQFTRDVIDTLGKRLQEVILPIPIDKSTRESIDGLVKEIVETRIQARVGIQSLSKEMTDPNRYLQ